MFIYYRKTIRGIAVFDTKSKYGKNGYSFLVL